VTNKLILKNSAYLYARMVAVSLIGLFTSRLVLKALGVSDYGLYNVVGGLVSMMAFVNTVMVSTTYRYIAFESGKADGNVNKIFNVSLLIHIGIALLVLALAFSLGLFYVYKYLKVPPGRLQAAVFVFSFSIINTVCIILATPFQGLLIAREKFSVTVPIEISTKLLNLGLVFLLGYMPGDRLKIYAIFVTLVHALTPILYILYCLRVYKEDVRWKYYGQWPLYREMLSFSGWIMLGAGAVMGEHQGTALIINRFFGTVMNASYGIANQVGSMLRMFTNGLGHAVVPQITKSYSSGDKDRSSRLVMLASKYSFLLLLMPALPVLLETEYILRIWLGVVPPYTATFVRIMILVELAKSAKAGLASYIQASGNIKWFQIVTSCITLSSLPLAYLAFWKGAPPYTITLLFAFTSILNLIVELGMMKKLLNYDTGLYIRQYLSRMLLILIFCVPLVLLHRFWAEGMIRLVLTLLIGEIYLMAVIYLVGTDDWERRLAKKGISIIINRFRIARTA